jgi:outer membrane protein, adhesin transport system
MVHRSIKLSELLLAMVLAGLSGQGLAMCGEDQMLPPKGSVSKARPVPDVRAPDTEPEEVPQIQILALVKEAIRRSGDLDAAALSEAASEDDLAQSIASERPRAMISGSLNSVRQKLTDQEPSRDVQSDGTFSVTGILYDGGLTSRLTEYRRELSKAARFNTQAQQEQVIVETMAAALNRGRYRQQAQVYQQYARKMSCLVDALSEIVAQDKGRASELLQARKTQQQAELSRDMALAQSRQAEIRMRRLVGEEVRLGGGFVGALAQSPKADEILQAIDQSGEVLRMQAQVAAGERYADAVNAGSRPQLSWVAAAQRSRLGRLHSSSYSAGINLSYNLFDWGSSDAAASSAAKRANAARRQYDEFMKIRTARVGELLDVATSSFERAKRYVEVLKDSERVRSATFQQWSQLGRRSLFDVMSSEGDHFALRVAYINALYDGYEANSQLRSLGGGLGGWMGVAANKP